MSMLACCRKTLSRGAPPSKNDSASPAPSCASQQPSTLARGDEIGECSEDCDGVSVSERPRLRKLPSSARPWLAPRRAFRGVHGDHDLMCATVCVPTSAVAAVLMRGIKAGGPAKASCDPKRGVFTSSLSRDAPKSKPGEVDAALSPSSPAFPGEAVWWAVASQVWRTGLPCLMALTWAYFSASEGSRFSLSVVVSGRLLEAMTSSGPAAASSEVFHGSKPNGLQLRGAGSSSAGGGSEEFVQGS